MSVKTVYIYNLVTEEGPPEDRENEMVAYLKIKVKIGIIFSGIQGSS